VTNQEPLTLTGRKLGALVLRDFCPRCFWIPEHMDCNPPFSIPLPGVFSNIDDWTKDIVHAHFAEYGRAPEWLSDIGHDVQSYVDPRLLTWQRYDYLDPETGIPLRGAPDDIFIAGNGDHFLLDYKTAKYTATQDRLLPMYAIQVVAYAWIAERARTFRPIKSTSLVYCEPVTGDIAARDRSNRQFKGFKLPFAPKVVPVELDLDLIPPLLRKARDILSLDKPPERKVGCNGCYAVWELSCVDQGIQI